MADNIITKEFTDSYIGKTAPWGFNGLGYVVYKRTYSRIKEDGSHEDWPETIARCINGAQEIGADYTQKEAERLFDHVFNLRCTFGGRMLWQLGTDTVRKFGGNSLLNCWFTTIKELEDFCFIFDNLMLGGGVGFSVRREDIHELPKVYENVQVTHERTKDADFIVPDSREGWTELLRKTLNAYYITGKSFTYSTILVRGAGEPIKIFGGQASGPGILIEGIGQISDTLKSRQGRKLRSVDVLDICNIIGSVVVSGNVRRSAEIAMGDPDDFLFIRAKRWDLGNIPNWRSASNNTIYADDYDHITEKIWDGYGGNGEPYGFFNLPLSQKYGRLGEKKKDRCEGMNPCGEITLYSKECCNLVEHFLNNIDTKEQMIDCAKLLYKTQKAIAQLPFIHDATTKIVHENMRLGQGITGICQSGDKLDWLDEVYTSLKEFDVKWSAKKGLPESIKLTTIKPSGTVSLLGGSTPGIHPGFSKYHLRRVSMSSNDRLVEYCRVAGYSIEYKLELDGTINHGTVVIEFPCTFSDNTVLAESVTAIEQLELLKKLQTIWADNSVSNTIYYKAEELDGIKKWLQDNYKQGVKSVSFLLHKDHGFLQAPLEEIDEATYRKRTRWLKEVVIEGDVSGEALEGLECEGGACPIK